MAVDLGTTEGILKLSSAAAGGAAAMVLLAPDRFQDTFYDTSVPRASLSVTRHHGIALAGFSALTWAVAAAPRSDAGAGVQRTALKAAGATWLASGLLNLYETADGQTTKATYAIAAVNCLLGGLCLWKAMGRNGGGSQPSSRGI